MRSRWRLALTRNRPSSLRNRSCEDHTTNAAHWFNSRERKDGSESIRSQPQLRGVRRHPEPWAGRRAEVIGLDCDPSHAGFATRYCVAKQCPHPVHEPDRLVEFPVRRVGNSLNRTSCLPHPTPSCCFCRAIEMSSASTSRSICRRPMWSKRASTNAGSTTWPSDSECRTQQRSTRGAWATPDQGQVGLPGPRQAVPLPPLASGVPRRRQRDQGLS